jgi:hypothetical protein
LSYVGRVGEEVVDGRRHHSGGGSGIGWIDRYGPGIWPLF